MSQHRLPVASDATSDTSDLGSSHQPGGETLALWQLPTMQRNALRKIFNRQDFTPDEVARLGHRRLGRAEGIGSKGLANIVDWLRRLGYELAGDARASQSQDLTASPKDVKKLQKAMRVLRTYGYTVLPDDQSENGGNDCYV